MNKRLILSATNKGGVGKSFLCIQLVEWLKRHPAKIAFTAFDPDHANTTLSSVHPDVTEFMDVETPRSIDRAVSVFKDKDISICDGLGSQQKKTFMAWAHEIDLFSIKEEIGFGITFLVVIEEDRDVILQTQELLKSVGDKVDWVIMKNHKQSTHNTLWEGTETQRLAHELKAIEIDIPRLHEHVATLLTAKQWSVAQAADLVENIMDRNRYRTLWRLISSEFEKAERYLLPSEALQQEEVLA